MSTATPPRSDHPGLLGSNRVDPTGTKTIRKQWGAQFHKRWRALKGVIRQGVGVEDRLAIDRRLMQGNAPPTPDDVPEAHPVPHLPPDAAEAVRLFEEWFAKRADDMIIGPKGPGGHTWSGKYVTYAYEKGADDAAVRLEQAGVSSPAAAGETSTPLHQRTLRLLHDNSNAALTGVTDETRKQVTRILADAMLEGKNPRTAARLINERVDAIGMTRAEAHAETMTVKAYNQAALNRYSEIMGEQSGVSVLSEFLTAQDSRVCQECAGLEGNVYSIREARGILPVHPRCRCTFLPVIEDDPSERGGLGKFLVTE